MDIVIIGDGKVGHKLAMQLSGEKYNVTLIDKSERKLRDAVNETVSYTHLAKKFIQKGDKVKVTLRFRGREMAHVQKTKQILDVFAEKMSDVAVVEKAPKMEGRQMMMFLAEKRQ